MPTKKGDLNSLPPSGKVNIIPKLAESTTATSNSVASADETKDSAKEVASSWEAAEFAAALESPEETVDKDRGSDGVKFRGQFCYLLQHRSPNTWKGMDNKGQNQLGFPGGQADPEDNKQPDITAWRECVEELCQ